MNKQMKLITTAGILGLFLVWNYAFELLAKIGAGIFSAVLTGQLTPEAWNSELYAAIGQQSLPFLLMIVIGAALGQWANVKGKGLADTDPEWVLNGPQRKESTLAIVGGLLVFAGFYNIFVPIYFGYEELIAGLSSPESAGYVMKAVLPNYAVLLIQMALGVWFVIGKKAAAIPVVEAVLPAEEDAAEGVDEEVPVALETAPVTEAAAEVPADLEEVNKVQ